MRFFRALCASSVVLTALPARAEEVRPVPAAPPSPEAAPRVPVPVPVAPPKPKRPDAPSPDQVVVTGTRTPERAQRSTIKTDVVTREEAERRGATNVAEALQSQPGVQVNPGAYGYLGGVSAIQIQGFDRDRVLILEDGERVVGDVGGAIDLASMSTADLSRIEIITGPTSSLYGTSAIGGVVNILTAPPGMQGASGRFRGEYRSYRGVVAQGGASYRKKDTWATVDGNFTRQDGVAGKPDLPDLTIPDQMRSLVGLRAGTRISKAVDVRIRARWIRDRSDGLETQLVPGLGRYSIELPASTNRFTLHAIEQVDLGKGSGIRLTLGRQWTENETKKDRVDSPLDEIRDRHHSMQSAEGALTLADGERTWVFGTRFEVERFSQDIDKTESFSTGLVTTQGVEVPMQILGTGAGYGQLAWKFAEKLTVLAGVRGEGHSRYGGALAPRLAIAYRPSSFFGFRASVGRGFRAPSAKELGFVFDHSFYGYRIVGNAALAPERSWGINGDVSASPDRSTLIRLGGYMNWVTDLIDIDTASGVTTNNVSSYTYKNFGNARTAGATFDVGMKLGQIFYADAGYAYLWTRDIDNDRPLGTQPPHTVTTSFRATIPKGLELYFRYRVVTDAFVDETRRAPGFMTADIRVSKTLWPKTQAYFGVLNSFDIRQEPGRIGDFRPPLGRLMYVGLRGELPSEEESPK